MLSYYLDSKKKLEFKNGSFRVLIFTDMHAKRRIDPRTLAFLEATVKREQPDLVLWDGDNVVDGPDEESFKSIVSALAEPMERRGIPWAQVFGNHDEECCFDRKIQQKIYESFDCNISKSAPGIHGVGNHMLPVWKDEQIALAFWGIDSNDYLSTDNDFYPGDLEKAVLLPKVMFRDCGYAFIRFDQIRWYWDLSVELERLAGGKVPGIMYFHTCLNEFAMVPYNPKETGMTGKQNEPLCPSTLNSGLFTALLERGDVKGVYCGHDHTNTYEGAYCGVRLGFCGSAGFGTYGLSSHYDSGPHQDADKHALRCARLLTFREENVSEYESEIILARDLIDMTPVEYIDLV
ncbi:MAG TPA: hypothetical protein DDZ89_05705 [Clostridiales bacterium]|nr:hypothetical protein [Clostridiales bacterium]